MNRNWYREKIEKNIATLLKDTLKGDAGIATLSKETQLVEYLMNKVKVLEMDMEK